MSFAAAVDHLHALGLELAPAPGSVPGQAAPRRKFDLNHMRILARALGDPETRFPAILIAGTNGKGSTAATLASILAAAGYRTGLYTSPHLTRVTERIRISTPPAICNAQPATFPEIPEPDPTHLAAEMGVAAPTPPAFAEIPESDFARLYFQVDDAARALVSSGQLPHHPSFFESLTALALLYFAGQQSDGSFATPVDIAILEVGLGGRLDATNIVDPMLSVITDIALDHQQYLGSTIAAIAREKAGILRPNGTLITLPQHPEANQAIGEIAVELNVRGINAAAYLPDRAGGVGAGSSLRGQHQEEEGALAMGVASPLPANHYNLTVNGEPLKVRSPLPGEHQRRNIALAIAVAIELRNQNSCNQFAAEEIRNQTGHNSSPLGLRTANKAPFAIPNSAIEAGIAHTIWPGRLEFLPPNLLLDVAHNPAGAWTLRAAIAALPESQPRTLIFSCLRDKDLTEMAQVLFPLFDAPFPSNLAPRAPRLPQHHLILTRIASPRATSLDDLLAAARQLDISAHPANSPAEALALARSLTPGDGLILATGSIYLIGALREIALPQSK